MPLIRARHDVYGVVEIPDTAHYLDNGWTEVDPSTPTADEQRAAGQAEEALAPAFDPAEHSVTDVVAYLQAADETERARVIDAELGRGEKARTTVTGWAE